MTKKIRFTEVKKLAENIFPYDLPKNWRWVKLVGDFAECLDSFRSPVNATERAKRIGNIPYYGATGQVGWIDDFLTDEQLVLLGEDGAPFLDKFKDKAYIIDGKAWVNNHAHILRSYFGNFGNKFMANYLNIFDFTDYVSGTTRLKLTQAKMKKILIPLPPIEEQKKIVERIESLFSKLDKAKSIVQKILNGYELRRSAILHKAFTGELINKKPLIVPSSEIFEKIFIGPFGTMLHKEEYVLNGIPVINSKHISNQKISPQANITISKKKAENLSSYRLLENDIIMGRRGEMGRTAPVTKKEIGWICGTGSLVLRSQTPIFAKFYSQILASQFCIQHLENFSVGSTMKNLNERIVKNIPIPLFTYAEQKEIVRVLDSLLDKEQRTKEIAEKTLQEIDLLKKSVLARAFRGEL